MRTIEITVKVPDGARCHTTDSDGMLAFWTERPETWELDMSPRPMKGGYHGRGGTNLGCIQTGIPCPTWRDSLVDLSTSPADEPAATEGV